MILVFLASCLDKDEDHFPLSCSFYMIKFAHDNCIPLLAEKFKKIRFVVLIHRS